MGRYSQVDIKPLTWVEIDLAQLEHNYRAIRTHLGNQVRIMAVVKADAYGHGIIAVSRRLVDAGADYLAVAILTEGVALRKAGIVLPILVLGGCWPGQEQAAVDYQLTPAIYSMGPLESLADAARRAEKVVPYHLSVDTGMGRLGVNYKDVMAFVGRSLSFDNVKLEGIFTHLSSADEDEDEYTEKQVGCFREVLEQLQTAGIEIEMVHVANSAGVLFHRQTWFNMVRPGLALYGINPNEQRGQFPIAPVLTLKTRILHLKRVLSGMPLGYNRTFITRRESLIATLPIGYADGLNRLSSNSGKVILLNQFAPLVATVSMDFTLIDVTDIAEVTIGDEVIIIGKSGALSITASDIAAQVQSIPYEVFCRIGIRVPRVYLH